MVKRDIPDSESRFCGPVSWTEHVSKDWKITWTLEEQEEKLTREANKNPPFKAAWEAAKTDSKLSSLKTRYSNSLVESEIKLIIAYTYDLAGRFYSDLNEDCRGSGNKYPIARRALQKALIKLSQVQASLPGHLYRKEPQALVNGYASWKKREALKQFTSTSRSKGAFLGGVGDMDTIFKKPRLGAYIAEFSPYDEEEVLLIPEYGFYMVESVDKQKKEAVLITAD